MRADPTSLDHTPLAYLITFSVYGAWLHGDARTSVDRRNNLPDTPRVPPDDALWRTNARVCKESPYVLDAQRRERVVVAVRRVCRRRTWPLHGVHVRSTHVHVVLSAQHRPEPIITALKAEASRQLADSRLPGEATRRRRWARHGSTRWLWRAEHVFAALRYVVFDQGAVTSLFVSDEACTFLDVMAHHLAEGG